MENDVMPFWMELSGNNKWKYRVKEEVTFKLFPRYVHLVVKSDSNKVIADLTKDGILTIYPGYCWDGATCAPDFPEVMRATLIHDLMCQLHNQENWIYDREDADYEFRRIAREDNFCFRHLYFIAICLFRIFKDLFLPNKKYKGVRVQKVS